MRRLARIKGNIDASRGILARLVRAREDGDKAEFQAALRELQGLAADISRSAVEPQLAGEDLNKEREFYLLELAAKYGAGEPEELLIEELRASRKEAREFWESLNTLDDPQDERK